MIQKLNLQIGYKSPASSSHFNATTRKVDEIIDAINRGDIPGAEPGTDALSAMLTNESAQINTKEDGTLSIGVIVKTRFIIYYGTSELSISSLITNHPELATTKASTGEVEVRIPMGYDLSDPLEIAVTGICSRGTISKILTISGARKGVQGDSVTNVGEWYEGLFVPYLGMVRLGNATYQCINPDGTYNPPVKVYATNSDEVLLYEDGGYVLSDELNEEEYRLVAKDGSNGNGSLVMGLSERTVGIQAIKKGTSYEAYADTDIRISVVATYDNEDIYPAVSGQSTLNGCTYRGTTDVIVRIPKGTSFRHLSVLYRCTLSYSIGEKSYDQECVVKAIPDTSYMKVKEDFDKALGEMKDFTDKVQGDIDKVADITKAVVVVKDGEGNPTGEVRIGSLTIKKNEISITDSNKNKAIIVPNLNNGGGMTFCPSAPGSDCLPVIVGDTSGGGGTLTPSDMRHKHVIDDVELDVDQIADAPIFDFTFEGNSMKHSGTSAQYWQKVLPNVVRGNDMLMMEYAQAAMVAVVSLARKVRELERKLNERQ